MIANVQILIRKQFRLRINLLLKAFLLLLGSYVRMFFRDEIYKIRMIASELTETD